ncbi:hypothetical protein K490DRAFT_39016, partial [Saccharata proteae CBS 121410]
RAQPEVEHAGYKRHIIARNPPRFDEDGDEIDDLDDDEEADLSAAEDNPQPYYSQHLTTLANSIRASLQQEEALLEKMKLILSRLLGDDPWVPVGMLETEYDHTVLEATKENGTGGESSSVPNLQEVADVVAATTQRDTSAEPETTKEGQPEAAASNPQQEETDDQMQIDGTDTASKTADEPSQADEDADDTNSQPASHRMTTRAQAHVHSSPPHSPGRMTPESLEAYPIHPLFSFPHGKLADRDVGLPAGEADETRQWLLLYCQKKEETVRQMRELHAGLMEADRKRKLVLKWSKAEGHIGEMSDGEDWVDKEEWGLTEDLLKGREEEEEEGVVQGKKTRARGRREDKEK